MLRCTLHRTPAPSPAYARMNPDDGVHSRSALATCRTRADGPAIPASEPSASARARIIQVAAMRARTATSLRVHANRPFYTACGKRFARIGRYRLAALKPHGRTVFRAQLPRTSGDIPRRDRHRRTRPSSLHGTLRTNLRCGFVHAYGDSPSTFTAILRELLPEQDATASPPAAVSNVHADLPRCFERFPPPRRFPRRYADRPPQASCLACPYGLSRHTPRFPADARIDPGPTRDWASNCSFPRLYTGGPGARAATEKGHVCPCTHANSPNRLPFLVP